uniref:Uncharacterized protein n=1 Tax=Strongyloides papillosus TaxID=174720 RepID=A0A0N5BTR1_STREA
MKVFITLFIIISISKYFLSALTCNYVIDIFTHCSCGSDEVEIKVINYQQPGKHFEELKAPCNNYPHRVKAVGIYCLSRVAFVSIKHVCNKIIKVKELDIFSNDCVLSVDKGDGRRGYNCYETRHLKQEKQNYQLPEKFQEKTKVF